MAVGEVDVTATRNDAAFLTSPDGLNWTVQYQVDLGAERIPRHLVIVGDELIAFSSPAIQGIARPGASEPLIWSSVDGTGWSLVDSPSWRKAWRGLETGPLPSDWDQYQYPIQTSLVGVASGPAGLVAIGNSYGDGELVQIVLRSTDGRAWSEVALPAESTSALLEDVVVFDGGFCLVGAVDVGPRIDTAMPAAWVSTHGRTWTETTFDASGGEFGRVVAGADGLLAWEGARQMHTGPRLTTNWASPDGRTWSPAEVPAGLSGLVAADGTRIVALGPMPNGATDPAQWPGISQGWVSTDGPTWTALDMPRGLDDYVEGMWVVPDGVIYAGQQSFWFGTPTVAP